MAKLDKQNRLIVPKSLIEISDTDFNEDVRLFFRGKELFLDNPSNKNSRHNCLGEIQLDKHNRFFVPKLARELLNLKPGDNISFYIQNGNVTFKKIFFVPENR
ncbi:MAG: hypothetical protein IJ272_04900 [Clostridia bacterium]|nr:hypothetical protein [Clostridia bacterium]